MSVSGPSGVATRVQRERHESATAPDVFPAHPRAALWTRPVSDTGVPGRADGPVRIARRDRARARERPEAAVPVRRLHARRVLRDRRSGGRLLRPLPAVLRPRAHRVPPPPRPRARSTASTSRCARRPSSITPPPASTTCSRCSCASRGSGRRASPTTTPPTGSTRTEDTLMATVERDGRLHRARRAQARCRCPTPSASGSPRSRTEPRVTERRSARPVRSPGRAGGAADLPLPLPLVVRDQPGWQPPSLVSRYPARQAATITRSREPTASSATA